MSVYHRETVRGLAMPGLHFSQGTDVLGCALLSGAPCHASAFGAAHQYPIHSRNDAYWAGLQPTITNAGILQGILHQSAPAEPSVSCRVRSYETFLCRLIFALLMYWLA